MLALSHGHIGKLSANTADHEEEIMDVSGENA